MTFSFGLIMVLAVVAGILAVLTLIGKPNGLVFTAVAVLLLAILEVVEHSGLH